MKKGRLILFGLAVLSVASVGATWAVWSDHEQTRNEYMIPQYKTELEEKFEKPENWQPGVEAEKRVWVTNEADADHGVPVTAKVVIEQNWKKHETGELVSLVFSESEKWENLHYAAIPKFTEDVYLLASGAIPEGSEKEGLKLGLPIVEDGDLVDLSDPEQPKWNPEMSGKWVLLNEDPNITGRFVLYYLGILQPGESSVPFLESVRMNPLLEPNIVTKKSYYETLLDGQKKLVTETERSAVTDNYEDCRYMMDIKATTVQATKDAIDEVFFRGRADEDVNRQVAEYLIAVGDDNMEDAALITEKRLRIEKLGGKQFVYTPYHWENGEKVNQFMSFTNMLPGGTYYDTLIVENTCFESADVFMQILPMDSVESELEKIGQSQIADELLDMIHMKVWLLGQKKDGTETSELMYDGKANGIEAKTNGGDLTTDVVSLCRVPGKDSVKVRVELKLDSGLTLDGDVVDPATGKTYEQLTGKTYQYAEVLSKIDWHFWIQKTKNPSGGGDNPPGGGNNPKKGLVTIDSSEVPLATMIPDPEVPLAGLVPKTGDNSHVLLFALTSVISMMMLIVLYMVYRKSEKKKD